jgi:hypothetical protein
MRTFEQRSRLVRLGGRKLGRLAFGGHWYEVRTFSALRFAQYLDGLAAAGAVLKDLGEAPFEALKALLPLVVLDPIRMRDLAAATPEQVLAAHLAAAEVNSFEYLADVLRPGARETGAMIPVRIAIAEIAERYRIPPHELVSWPAASVLVHLEHPKTPEQSDEARAAVQTLQMAGMRFTQ